VSGLHTSWGLRAAAVSAVGLIGWFGLRPMWRSESERAVRTELLPLSPQECDTECQSRQTDCILDCDGAVTV